MYYQNYACQSCLTMQILCGIIFHIMMRNKIFTNSKSVFAQHNAESTKCVRSKYSNFGSNYMCCMQNENFNRKTFYLVYTMANRIFYSKVLTTP